MSANGGSSASERAHAAPGASAAPQPPRAPKLLQSKLNFTRNLAYNRSSGLLTSDTNLSFEAHPSSVVNITVHNNPRHGTQRVSFAKGPTAAAGSSTGKGNDGAGSSRDVHARGAAVDQDASFASSSADASSSASRGMFFFSCMHASTL